MPHGRVRTNFKRKDRFSLAQMPYRYTSWLRYAVDTYESDKPYFTESKAGTRYLIEGQSYKSIRKAAKQEFMAIGQILMEKVEHEMRLRGPATACCEVYEALERGGGASYSAWYIREMTLIRDFLGAWPRFERSPFTVDEPGGGLFFWAALVQWKKYHEEWKKCAEANEKFDSKERNT